MIEGLTLRPKQVEVVRYRSGRMGVAAVPGSGKTLVLSALAARLLLEVQLSEGQEILVVTLTNSAVENFTTRVNGLILQSRQTVLLPNFRVRTLHGLAHDIVRERPGLVGLAEDFMIIDERAADSIRSEVARAWLQANPHALDDYLDQELDENKLDWVRRERLPELVEEIALSFIRTAKDRQLTPERLKLRLEDIPLPLPLLEMGLAIFREYQRALAYRGAVDFDDLIRLALQALEQDEMLLERLRQRWPYILEDEAQDSSFLQEQILRQLTGEAGNWVRVGDPNQAIYETFTTASPEYLRDFIQDPFVIEKDLPNSGRSTRSIIFLANELVKWVQQSHPLPAVRDALYAPPYIQPTPAGDPQKNPEDAPQNIHLVDRRYTPGEEVAAVVGSLENWLSDHLDRTVAVLAPTNHRAFQVVDELKRREIPYNDNLLRSSSATRTTAGRLGTVLQVLADPDSARRLSKALEAWRSELREQEAQNELTGRAAAALRRLRQVEDFLWPRAGQDWLADSGLSEQDPQVYELLEQFRELMRRWQSSVLLPVDQIVLTLSQDLFAAPGDLAVAHKLALLLRSASNLNPDWRLPELTQELAVIARNERRFLGFSEDDSGFNPQNYAGQVVVATMHKAKGLEWDRVYLMSVNNYDFPSGYPYDSYRSEKWYVRDQLNLDAETRAQLEALVPRGGVQPSPMTAWPELGQPSQQARLEYIRERLRLLYVGITRARQGLIITWNTGRRGDLQPAVPVLELQRIWEEHYPPAAGEDPST